MSQTFCGSAGKPVDCDRGIFLSFSLHSLRRARNRQWNGLRSDQERRLVSRSDLVHYAECRDAIRRSKHGQVDQRPAGAALSHSRRNRRQAVIGVQRRAARRAGAEPRAATRHQRRVRDEVAEEASRQMRQMRASRQEPF